jgi:hypothetical protein
MLKENDRLQKELGNRAFTAQANLKRIVERFRAQTTVAIQAATVTALQTWAEQAAELQVLRERTNAENARLHQVMSDQQAELDKERKEREAADC